MWWVKFRTLVKGYNEFNIVRECNNPTPPAQILSVLRSHTPHGFVLPQSTQQWGKRPLPIEGRSFLINTFPCASLGDVGFHGMQDPHFWVTTIHPLYGHTRLCVQGPHFWLGHGSDTICNNPTLPMQILFALGPYTSHGFILPQSTHQWGKMPLHIEGRLFLINTFSCASLGDADNIYTGGVGLLQMVSELCLSRKCGPHTRGRICL